MAKIYDTHIDKWERGQQMPGSWHVFLGPCPACGKRTFDYGGGWRCVDSYCVCSAENPAPSLGSAPDWWDTDVRVFKDGVAWCAVYGSFVNLQESDAGFGASPREAILALAATPADAPAPPPSEPNAVEETKTGEGEGNG